MKTLITHAKIVQKDCILEDASLLIADGKICAVGADIEETEADKIVDAEGKFLIPGMVDIHSDMIENYIQPRSTAVMDFSLGLMEAERALAMCGITTMFHSISMFREGAWDVKEIRQAPQVKKLASLISRYKHDRRLIRHRYHLRYEIDNIACYEGVKKMVEDGLVDLISFMDHSPGQGQYKNLEIYRKHLPNAGTDITDEEFEELIWKELEKDVVSYGKLKELAELAQERGISIASHDDDTVEKLEVNETLGVNISEFPITMDVAKEAVSRGFKTVLGAPNILLGGSHSGNLSAMEAIREDAASILVSDYYPQALLQAVFRIWREGVLPLWEAVNLVTKNPAEAVGAGNAVGTIEEGKRADFLLVNADGMFPSIEQVFVDGVRILDCTYREAKGE